MKNRWIVLLAMFVAGTAMSLRAQTPAPAQAKIGVLNMQVAISNTGEGKKMAAELQKKYTPRRQELERLNQEIQAIQDQLTKQAATLSEEEQGRLSRDAEGKQKLLKRSAEDAQNDLDRDRQESLSKIGQKMARVISEYAQQNGYTLILDDGQVPIYFASKDIELTAEIIKRYDAANPVAAETPAPATPAPKPAATHPATPAAPPKHQ